MTIETYLLYLAALGVFFATPPDTSQLLVIANSARHGLKKCGWTIAGDLTANGLQMTAAAFGIAAVIAASAEAFQIVKWVGVAYLACQILFETIVGLIGNTRTDAGLRVRAEFDTGKYPKGVTATDEEMEALSPHRDEFHGDWNHELRPR